MLIKIVLTGESLYVQIFLGQFWISIQTFRIFKCPWVFFVIAILHPSEISFIKICLLPDHRFLALSLIGETATCYEPQSIQSPSVAAMYWCYSKSSTYHWRIEFANYQHQLGVLLSQIGRLQTRGLIRKNLAKFCVFLFCVMQVHSCSYLMPSFQVLGFGIRYI